MGVKRLSTFMDKDLGNFSSVDLLTIKNILIDGNGLVHSLYEKDTIETGVKIPYEFGGDYTKYAAVVRNYFETLNELNITPIVIFDGSHDSSEHDLEKHKNRQKYRFANVVSFLTSSKEHNDSFKPINLYEVFKNILSEMNIQHAQCYDGGDKYIASLATLFECPVLSEDSDFYIYDLPHGFIRLSHLHSVLPPNTSDVRNNCCIYYIREFLKKYSIRDRSLLSLLAALVGNDYADQWYFRSFHKDKFNHTRANIGEVLKWLKSYDTLDKAKKDVIRIYHHQLKTEITDTINYIVNNYEFDNADGEHMRNILNGIRTNCVEDIIMKTKMYTPCDKLLPKEFIVSFHKGRLSSTLLNIIKWHRSFLHCQIEIFTETSSYSCSRYIRKVTYSILCMHEPDDSDNHENYCKSRIVEYDRLKKTNADEKHTEEILVETCSELQNGEPIPQLSEVYVKSNESLRSFVCSVLGVDESLLKNSPGHLQLLFGCIKYWLLNAEPKPTKNFLAALLVCITYYEIKGNDFQEKSDKKETELLKNVSSTLVIEKFNRYLKKPDEPSKNDIQRIIHSYSQLQTCIWSIVTLNSLLNSPFDSSKMCLSLNGTMLFNLTKELESVSDSESVISTLFGGEDKTIELFNMYANKIKENQIISD